MYKLEYFYYVIEIAKEGSINRAAQNLYISQPYLSVSLKNIEDILGVKLFKRTNQGVTPTKAGEKFIEYSKNIISSVNDINNLKEKYCPKNTNFSVISMPSYTFLDLIYGFKKISYEKYPSCVLSYKEIPNTYIAKKIYNGEANIGIIYTTSTTEVLELENFKKMDLHFTPLTKDPLAAIVSKYNPLYDQSEVLLEDLDGLNFLVENIKLFKNKPPSPNNPFPEVFKTNDEHTLKFNNNRSMLYYLSKSSNSFCIGQNSLNITNPLVNSGDLKYLPIVDFDVHFTIGYLINEHIESSETEELFIDYMENYFDSNHDLNTKI